MDRGTWTATAHALQLGGFRRGLDADMLAEALSRALKVRTEVELFPTAALAEGAGAIVDERKWSR